MKSERGRAGDWKWERRRWVRWRRQRSDWAPGASAGPLCHPRAAGTGDPARLPSHSPPGSCIGRTDHGLLAGLKPGLVGLGLLPLLGQLGFQDAPPELIHVLPAHHPLLVLEPVFPAAEGAGLEGTDLAGLAEGLGQGVVPVRGGVGRCQPLQRPIPDRLEVLRSLSWRCNKPHGCSVG